MVAYVHSTGHRILSAGAPSAALCRAPRPPAALQRGRRPRQPKLNMIQGEEQPSEATGNVLSLVSRRLKVYSGSSNAALTERVSQLLGNEAPDEVICRQFADGERYIRIVNSVRGCNVFVVQSTCDPVNEHLMELLLMVDACRRAHASQIIAVLPYYGYARADRIIDPDHKRREALTSKLVSNLICESGADRVILVEIHSPQSCGFFDIPVEHIYALPVLTAYVKSQYASFNELVVVSPDTGGVARARAYAKDLQDAPLAIVDKRRPNRTSAEVVNLVGDVEGRTAVIVDDLIDTASTITVAAELLRERGAARVIALATHGVFSGPAIERLSSGLLEEVIVTDTVPVPEHKRFPQLRIVSCASLISDVILRVHEETSHYF
ncbi:hypothetical protein CDCA_CDCA07G2106 [Cyanidium caldarium]|uniref:ribose-phosphate diphosphokinase n=1 Tax=Cyanidium caldarium TaxID=2771 RepID=A0AAV9IVK0_CYACA|nr:hypothetical protein CDCA_CDCA07G2106 [Cyanidium caldarium]